MGEAQVSDGAVMGPDMTLEPGWIDYNDHLNMAYYHVIFDRSLDVLFDRLGLGQAYRDATGCSVMTAEVHVNYVREVLADATVRVASRIIDCDAKRVHCYQELYHAEGWLAATSECMVLHVDLNARKVTAMPETAQAAARAFQEAHAGLPPSRYLGRTIGIRRQTPHHQA